MDHNINAVPAKIESSLVANHSAQVETERTVEQKAQAAAEVKKIAEDELILNKQEKVEAEQKREQASEADIESALEIVSSFVNSTLKQVDFTNDHSSGKMVIKVSDKETKEIIQQFPSEKIISMAEKIKELHQEVESVTGLLVDSHV